MLPCCEPAPPAEHVGGQRTAVSAPHGARGECLEASPGVSGRWRSFNSVAASLGEAATPLRMTNSADFRKVGIF